MLDYVGMHAILWVHGHQNACPLHAHTNLLQHVRTQQVHEQQKTVYLHARVWRIDIEQMLPPGCLQCFLQISRAQHG